MPPRIPKSPGHHPWLRRKSLISAAPSQRCLICISAQDGLRPAAQRKRPVQRYRNYSELTNSSPPAPLANDPTTALPSESSVPRQKPRAQLKNALLELQKHAAPYVPISKLQLALRNLEQAPGQETIRVGILGLASTDADAPVRLREFVRVLLADPLLAENEDWERELCGLRGEEGLNTDDIDCSKPILIKIGPPREEDAVQIQVRRMVQELYISSPLLNGLQLEILVYTTWAVADEAGAVDGFADQVLVPMVDIQTSGTGRHTSITHPVHKAVVLGEGLDGVAQLARVNKELREPDDLILTVIDWPAAMRETSNLNVTFVDQSQAANALALFRTSIDNAMEYERGWFASKMPEVLDWIKDGAAPPASPVELKIPVAKLISSLLRSTRTSLVAAQAQLQPKHSSEASLPATQAMREYLADWSATAHTELRDNLSAGLHSARWRSLKWYKLFWRVDDVTHLSTSILNRNFLPMAEQNSIFVAGLLRKPSQQRQSTSDNTNITGATTVGTKDGELAWAQKPIIAAEEQLRIGNIPSSVDIAAIMTNPPNPFDSNTDLHPAPWPQHIAWARHYLQSETIPALQALAQKLVLQTATTISASSAFAGLIYVADSATSVYEAGAVAALGIVVAAWRLQGRWESARVFWEGEVREEGRKAVKGVETALSQMIDEKSGHGREGSGEVEADAGLRKAREVLERAEKALEEARS